MVVPNTKTIKIKSERDAIRVSKIAFDIASKSGFDKLSSSEVTLAVSEIAGNAVKFAGAGVVKITIKKNKRVLEVIIQDNGPGIKNVKTVIERGHSTTKRGMVGGLGLGLAGAKRAMDEFQIKSKVGQGTTVIMAKYLPIPEEEIEYGIVSLSDSQQTINGDAYVIKEFEGENVLLAVIDGLGEGEKANKAANFVKDLIEDNYKLSPAALINKCDDSLKKDSKRGSAVGILLLKLNSLQYLGIGDTGIRIFSKDKITPYSQSGIVGEFRLPTFKLQKYPCTSKIIVIMWTDGITPKFIEEDLPLNQSAQKIANFIMDNYRREYGDATVLVAKRKK